MVIGPKQLVEAQFMGFKVLVRLAIVREYRWHQLSLIASENGKALTVLLPYLRTAAEEFGQFSPGTMAEIIRKHGRLLLETGLVWDKAAALTSFAHGLGARKQYLHILLEFKSEALGLQFVVLILIETVLGRYP